MAGTFQTLLTLFAFMVQAVTGIHFSEVNIPDDGGSTEYVKASQAQDCQTPLAPVARTATSVRAQTCRLPVPCLTALDGRTFKRHALTCSRVSLPSWGQSFSLQSQRIRLQV